MRQNLQSSDFEFNSHFGWPSSLVNMSRDRSTVKISLVFWLWVSKYFGRIAPPRSFGTITFVSTALILFHPTGLFLLQIFIQGKWVMKHFLHLRGLLKTSLKHSSRRSMQTSWPSGVIDEFAIDVWKKINVFKYNSHWWWSYHNLFEDTFCDILGISFSRIRETWRASRTLKYVFGKNIEQISYWQTSDMSI